jgi:hypothetical protein
MGANITRIQYSLNFLLNQMPVFYCLLFLCPDVDLWYDKKAKYTYIWLFQSLAEFHNAVSFGKSYLCVSFLSGLSRPLGSIFDTPDVQ